MKQNLLKNSFLRGVLFLLLCIVGISNAWGEEVTVTLQYSDVIGKGTSEAEVDFITPFPQYFLTLVMPMVMRRISNPIAHLQ